MTRFAPSEIKMWATTPTRVRTGLTDDAINAKYGTHEHRIVTETNRENLLNFVEALKRPGWMTVRPFYQRRARWDRERQSKLIESFIINIPVPPLFVYETELATYEVMDGQQRITAIQDFYADKFKLTGLDLWSDLNGRTYSQLPAEIRKGIDRRSISYVVVLHESATSEEQKLFLKQLVFERLNTGGVHLTQQEIRNCLYQGPFNDLLISLAQLPSFRNAWGLPDYDPDERDNPSPELLASTLYSKFEDVEQVLRFFALRHVEYYQGGMQRFLDLYMIRAKAFTTEDLQILSDTFHHTLSLAQEVYGDLLFRPYVPSKNQWAPRPQRAFVDAVLVGFNEMLNYREDLVARRDEIIAMTRGLFQRHPPGTFTGRGNTKRDVQERIQLFEDMLKNAAMG